MENRIVELFNAAKSIYKRVEEQDDIAQEFELQLKQIQKEFIELEDQNGKIFCLKSFSIISEKKGDKAIDNREKHANYKLAHSQINEAVSSSQINMQKQQPSLAKRQAVIKGKLGLVEHELGNNDNGYFLEKEASKIFGYLLHEHPDYGEAHLNFAEFKYGKMLWQTMEALIKITSSLNVSKNLYIKPVHTQHAPDYSERENGLTRIDTLTEKLNKISLILTGIK